MNPRTLISRVLVLTMAAAMTACGSSSSAPAGSNPNDPVTIQSYTVTGTSAAVNGVAPINPGVNNGQFSASWTVTGNNIYTTRIAISTDTIYDGGDIDIVNGGCGKASVADNCHTTGTVTCTFSNANVMACSDLVAAFPTRDLSIFLGGGVPMNAYLVIRACNPLLTSCPTSALPIQIQ